MPKKCWRGGGTGVEDTSGDGTCRGDVTTCKTEWRFLRGSWGRDRNKGCVGDWGPQRNGVVHRKNLSQENSTKILWKGVSSVSSTAETRWFETLTFDVGDFWGENWDWCPSWSVGTDRVPSRLWRYKACGHRVQFTSVRCLGDPFRKEWIKNHLRDNPLTLLVKKWRRSHFFKGLYGSRGTNRLLKNKGLLE